MKDFEEYYKLYCEELEKNTNGLVKPTKSDFIKMYAFYTVVDHEIQQEYMDKVAKAFKKVRK